MKSILILTLLVGTLFSCKPAALSLPNEVAQTYGIDKFDQVKSIAFTFHVQKGDKNVSRKWRWYPHDKRIESIKPDGTISYNQNGVLTEEQKKIDAKFINDSYWLLFPFYLKWNRDSYMTYVDENATAPISKKKAKMLTVAFNKADGYTPGDAYDLYLSEKNEIIEWSYRPGGKQVSSLNTTWSGIKDFDGVKIATQHEDGTGHFKLWFEDVVVEMR